MKGSGVGEPGLFVAADCSLVRWVGIDHAGLDTGDGEDYFVDELPDCLLLCRADRVRL